MLPPPPSPEAEFLDEIQTKALRVFLLAIHSHLYSFALRFLFLQTHATSHSFYCIRCKGERRKPGRKPYPLPSGLKNPYRNLKSVLSPRSGSKNLATGLPLSSISQCTLEIRTLIKEKKNFLIYKEIQMGSGAKSYMRMGLLIFEERKCANFSP
jgi:hypothetical protein